MDLPIQLITQWKTQNSKIYSQSLTSQLT